MAFGGGGSIWNVFTRGDTSSYLLMDSDRLAFAVKNKESRAGCALIDAAYKDFV